MKNLQNKIKEEVSRLEKEKKKLEPKLDGDWATNYYEPYDIVCGQLKAYNKVLEGLEDVKMPNLGWLDEALNEGDGVYRP